MRYWKEWRVVLSTDRGSVVLRLWIFGISDSIKFSSEVVTRIYDFAGSFYGSAEGFSTVRFGSVEVRFYEEDL